MPYTPAHPAILLPLRKIKFITWSWTALVAGSVVPDSEYFLWLQSGSFLSHTFKGIFLYDLPMTVILAFIWHRIIRPSITTKFTLMRDRYILPGNFRFTIKGWKQWIVFIYSALTGIFSHLAWDAFCHRNGFMVKRIPWLLHQTAILHFPIKYCYIVWYLSSVIGLILVLNQVVSFRKSLKIFFQTNFTYSSFWINVWWLTISITLTRCMIGMSENISRHFIIILTGSFMYAFCISSMIEKKQLNN